MSGSALFPLFPSPFFLLGCSPRAGGNSDAAVRVFAENYISAGPPPGSARPAGWPAGAIPPVYLRAHHVLPCTGCDCCRRYVQTPQENAGGKQKPENTASSSVPGASSGHSVPDMPDCPSLPRSLPPLAFGCPLTLRDDSTALLHNMCTATGLCFVSPIYFYHLPAAFKALLDRMQPFWSLAHSGDRRFLRRPRSRAHVVLIAARKTGRKLFEGSLLTLKYALLPLNIHLAEPLLLRGLDNPGDLAASAAALDEVRAYARRASAASSHSA